MLYRVKGELSVIEKGIYLDNKVEYLVQLNDNRVLSVEDMEKVHRGMERLLAESQTGYAQYRCEVENTIGVYVKSGRCSSKLLMAQKTEGKGKVEIFKVYIKQEGNQIYLMK